MSQETDILRQRILVALEQHASQAELVAVLRDAEAQGQELQRLQKRVNDLENAMYTIKRIAGANL